MESRLKESASIGDGEILPVPMVGLGLRVVIYGMFFLSGATALVFEILWSRQFVTLFGNSSYAISVVLCAYMAGIGMGALLGGRLADRFPGGQGPGTQKVVGALLLICGVVLLIIDHTGYPDVLLFQRSLALVCLFLGGRNYRTLLREVR